MSDMELFESTLKEVVNGKRLSASKMGKLTEIALKNMENDTQLVSILYRTHKSLPVVAKVSSLYVFDALCRAARHQATKQGITGDIHAEKGNAATFLLKVEGVLDGLVQDMVVSGNPESKEKTKKILDIWKKSSTFPPAVISRLTELAAKAEKEKETKKSKSPTATSDPRTQGVQVAPPPTPPVVVPPLDAAAPPSAPGAAALLALLTAAQAAVSNGQTPANNGTAAPVTATQPQLDPLQLALLQQLANKAHLGSVPPVQTVPVPVPVSLVLPPGDGVHTQAGPSQSQSPPHHRDLYPNSDRKDPRGGRPEYQEHGRGRDEYHEDRRDFRGGASRGGGFRGRGRDDFRGPPRYGDRDRFSQARDREEEHGLKRRRSRSRSRSQSPQRSRFSGAGRSHVKPYSPPRRPSIAQAPLHSPVPQYNRPPPPGAAEAGKDEFGRDIRPSSVEPELEPELEPEPAVRAASEAPPVPAVVKQPPTAPAALLKRGQANLPGPQSPVVQGQSPPTGSGAGVEGLDKFNMATFDVTDPASWAALGQAYAVTNGYLPSQEELMAFLSNMMGMSAAAADPSMVSGGQWSGQTRGESGPQTFPRGGGVRGGRGRGRGWVPRGGHHFGGRSDQGEWGYAGNTYGQETEAIVLGGDGMSGVGNGTPSDGSGVAGMHNGGGNAVSMSPPSRDGTQSQLSGSGGGAGGQMRKVGDKWVFVREGAAMGVA